VIKLHEFIIENVRCFQGSHRANIRPITLLVGENSTGKTSFLGSYRALVRMMGMGRTFPDINPNFNLEPFNMGAFRDIVRRDSRKSNRPDTFILGCNVSDGKKKYDILFTFIEEGSEPEASSLRFNFSSQSYLDIKLRSRGRGILKIPGHTIKFSRRLGFPFISYLEFINILLRFSDVKEWAERFQMSQKDVKALSKFIEKEFGTKSIREDNSYSKLGIEKSIAPLRSKPRRTYDPITESPTSEGEHVPMLMMRLRRTKDENWNVLHDDLVEFGRQSGLFSDIKIKSHDKQINDPFQLQLKIRKSLHTNIMDVGYGVSQILPILVEIMRSRPTTFLLQQPEVNLHPRGQAEFSTFLAESVVKRDHSFLIETHSDNIIDRMRISVREGIINPEDISILYFEPKGKGSDAVIYNIEVDEHGNLKNAPPSYRDFFMNETDRLLGFKE